MMEDGSVFKSIFAILQWWGFNVPVIIINKWIFQVLKLKPLIIVESEDRWKKNISHVLRVLYQYSFGELFLQWLVWRKYFDWRIWASLVPIVGGILLTSLTELSFNMLGFCAALFGCLATSTKTILAELLLHGFKFDRNPISLMNAVGCTVTLVGCTLYGYIRHLLSQQLPATPRTPETPRNRIEMAQLIKDKLDDKV
ncbi:hypothetical protein AgCh_012730 [Apium graveolens]